MEDLLEFTVEKHEKKLREYLKKQNLSSRFLRRASREGRVKLNGKVSLLSHPVFMGDKVEINLRSSNESQDIEPEKMQINVAYEDLDIVVVNKPPHMVVHPTKSYQSGTLANGLLYYFKENGENCIVRLVSRLDMNTSGLIMVAKNQYSHMAMSNQIKGKDFKKTYIAVAHGIFKEKSGVIDLPIYRPEDGSIKRVIDERGRRSITNYKVLAEYNDASLVELTLETGRTHQIRVHLSNIGHPIFGDTLYGIDESDENYIDRQALHAYELEFNQPRTGERIKISSDIPDDIKFLISNLKDRV